MEYTHAGELVGVRLTNRPPASGAAISFNTTEERSDLDDELRPPRGWHWSIRSDGDLMCQFEPSDDDVLAQLADDLAEGLVHLYTERLGMGGSARLRQMAVDRMRLLPEEAARFCASAQRCYERRWEEESS
jgi:hypothetical protein